MVAPLSGTTGIGALLTQFLGTLVQQGAEHTADDAARLSTVVLDLVTTFLAHELQADQTVPPDVHHSVRGEFLVCDVQDEPQGGRLSRVAGVSGR